jgi:SPP1 gp7 family putative phage head morphogenesis protein
VNQKLLERSIRHAVLFEQLKDAEVLRTLDLLNKRLFPRIMAEVEERLEAGMRGVWTTARQRRLTAAINKMIEVGYARDFEKPLSNRLKKLAVVEAEATQALLAGAMPPTIGIEMLVPSAKFLNDVVASNPFHGRILKPYFTGLKANTKKGMDEAVKLGMAQGETMPQVTNRVRKHFRRVRHEVEAWTRTAISDVSNKSTIATFRANKDVVSMYVFIATLDARTTDICASLDGKKFPLSSGTFLPALHFG